MATTYESSVLNEVLEPVARCFTREVAQQIVALRAPTAVQERLDDFAAKANEGELNEEERREYAAHVEAIDLVAILQAMARKVLQNGAL